MALTSGGDTRDGELEETSSVDGVEESKQDFAGKKKKRKKLGDFYLQFEPLRALMKDILGSAVDKVMVSSRSMEAPCSLRDGPRDASNKIMEVNAKHSIVRGLQSLAQAGQCDKTVRDLVWLLFDAAKLTAGVGIADSCQFVTRLYHVAQSCLCSRDRGSCGGDSGDPLCSTSASDLPAEKVARAAGESDRTQAVATDPVLPNNLPSKDNEQRQIIFNDPRHSQACRGYKGTGGFNTQLEDQDPASTLVPPAMRVVFGQPGTHLDHSLSSDDVFVVPSFLCDQRDLSLYQRLVDEVCEATAKGCKESDWKSWKNGSHLISKVPPESSATYREVLGRIKQFFCMEEDSVYVRFNWYVNGSDWKPLHHDVAAFSKKREGKQNITVGVSLGAERELVFRHAQHGTLTYFPQPNGTAFSFGRAVNINWKHGINALLPEKQAECGGRISIIVWGWTPLAVETHESATYGELSGSSLSVRPEAFNKPCLQFQRGKCDYGDRCKFTHISPSLEGDETG